MDLPGARKQIDAIDETLVRLLNERASLAQTIGQLKQGDAYRPEREADVLRRAMERNQGPLDDATVARVLRELMSACLRLESPMTVAYLGPEGTYTEDAMRKFFGDAVDGAPEAHIADVFTAVESGRAHHGVVPVENNTAGVVGQTLMRFVGSPLRIVGEVSLPIQHALLARKDAALDCIRGHEQALAQCAPWLDANHPDVPRIAVSSNAEAARLAAHDGGAAIASERAAQVHGLHVISPAISDPRNRTRFLAIGNQDVPVSGIDKTTIVVAARNRPGALLDLLRPFADAGVNIARVQSLPAVNQPWQDHFFVDIDGHHRDLAPQLATIEADAAFYAMLGSYPAAVL